MSELVLRRATPADAEAVRALTRDAYAKWVPVIGREPRPMTADYDRAVVEHRIDLLEDDGRLAALIEMSPEVNHLLIVNIAVQPGRQGNGLGTRLLGHAEGVAHSLGLPELRLYTNAAFSSNIALYRRRGYVEDRREPAGPLGIVVFMSKRLGSAP
jgi:GNAT superfamily N-acetyltransferase